MVSTILPALFLVICMMVSFAGCISGEENHINPSTIETTGPTDSTDAIQTLVDFANLIEDTHAVSAIKTQKNK